jgi:hypothetical protein
MSTGREFAAGPSSVTLSGARGVYIGDRGVQVTLFAGNVPQAPPAFRPTLSPAIAPTPVAHSVVARTANQPVAR